MNSPLKKPEACPNGGEVATAQLYCMDFSCSDHPFSINVFEGNVSASDLAYDLSLVGLLDMAQEAAAAYAPEDYRRARIKAVQESEIVGIALSQVCGFKTDGIVHGSERLACIIFGIDTGTSVYKAEHGNNLRAPWMAFASTQGKDSSIMLGTMPLTHEESAASTLVAAVPVHRAEKAAFLGIRRKPDEHYMGMHRVIDGNTIHPAIEHIIPRSSMPSLTLGDFLRYSV